MGFAHSLEQLRTVVLGMADRTDRRRLADIMLRDLGWSISGRAGTVPTVVELVGATRPDVVLLGLDLPSLQADRAIAVMRRRSPRTVICTTGGRERQIAARLAMTSGAWRHIWLDAPNGGLVESLRELTQILSRRDGP